MTRATRPLRLVLDAMRPLTYGIVQAGDDFPGGVPYIRPIDMTATNGVKGVEGLLRTSPAIAAQYKRSEVRTGDVVLSIGPSYGKVMIVPSELDGANLTQGTARLAPGKDVTSRWLYWILQSQPVREYWDTVVAGGTFSALNLAPLGATPIHCPPVDVQRRIADFLDDQVSRLDKASGHREVQAALLSERAASINSSVVESLGELHGWTPLRRYARRIRQGWSPQCHSSAADEGEWGVLKVGAVRQGRFRPHENKRLPADLDPLPEYEISAGDLLFSRANTPQLVGDVCLVPDGVRPRLLLCDKLMRVELAGGLMPEYVALVGRSARSRAHFSSLSSGTSQSMVNIRAEDVAGLMLPFCGLEEQRNLVAEAWELDEAADRAISSLRRSRLLLGERKRSLITAAVTGEVDVSAASSRAADVALSGVGGGL